jgi:hypothetical protein
VALSAVAGWGLAGDPGGAGGVTPAAIAAAVCLLAVSTAVPAVAPGGILVAAVAAYGAAMVAGGAPPASVAAIVVVAGAIALRLWPPLVSRVLSELAAPEAAQAEVAARRSRRLLASLSAGTAVLLLAAALTLLAGGGGFAVCLALVALAALVLRSRTYRFVPEGLPPALAAGAGLVVLELVVAWRSLVPAGNGALAVLLLAGTGLALGGLSMLPRQLATPGRGVRIAWLAVDVAIGPLALGTLGVYGLLAQLAHNLIH